MFLFLLQYKVADSCRQVYIFSFEIFIFFVKKSIDQPQHDDMVTLELLGSENFMRHN